jgi:chromosome segregation ATPase
MLSRRLIFVLAACTIAGAQDSQSLGDVARQARKQKQIPQTNAAQSRDGQSAAASKPTHVVTNDELPEKPETSIPDSHALADSRARDVGMSKRPPEYWKAQILRVKNAIAKLQKNVDNLSSSIHFVDANYENHVLWNERQREKQQQVDIMKSQLSEFQKLLEDMQEAARSQGYGSSVYDP